MFRFSYKSLNLLSKLQQPHRQLYLNLNKFKTISLTNYVCTKTFYSSDARPSLNIKTSPLFVNKTDDPTSLDKDDTQKKEEDKKKREQSWRRMKYTLMVFGLSFPCLGVYLIMELGKPRIGEDGEPIIDQFTKYPLWKQYLLRTLSEMQYYKNLLQEPSRDKLLPDPLKYPYHQPKYTLILEFTDVLVHPDWTYSTGWRFKKRPGIDNFLETLSGVYEIVVYTAEQGMTVFPIVEALDPKNHISYKLVRDATLFVDGRHVKDIDKLNRDLSKVIVIDWDSLNTKYHPENVLPIPRWKGNDEDVTLLHLSSFLLAIAQNGIEDVRDVLTYYNQFDDPLAVFREKQKTLLEMAEAQAEEAKSSQTQAPVKRWTATLFKKSF